MAPNLDECPGCGARFACGSLCARGVPPHAPEPPSGPEAPRDRALRPPEFSAPANDSTHQPPDFSAFEPVGLVEIAERLEVQRGSADQWRTRGLLPPPRWIVGGRPAWEWSEIATWARQTRRWPYSSSRSDT